MCRQCDRHADKVIQRKAGRRAGIARKAASLHNCRAGGCFNITGNFDGRTDIAECCREHLAATSCERLVVRKKEKLMHQGCRYFGFILLSATLAAPLASARPVIAQEREEHDRDRDREHRRVYDRDHHDYHDWDDREDSAYRHWREERHEAYVDYNRLKRRQQREYWRWRHEHMEHEEHEHH